MEHRKPVDDMEGSQSRSLERLNESPPTLSLLFIVLVLLGSVAAYFKLYPH